MQLKNSFPKLYQALLPEELLSFDLNEEKATCDSCYRASSNYKGKYPYQESLKCCTFQPFLPNFLVGAILKDKIGADRVQHKIFSREYSLPIGIVPTPKYQIEFNKRKPGDFGQVKEWLCPYYERAAKNCSIWRNRGVVCTTFFCTSSYGNKGKQFWKELNQYLSYVEMALMEECLVRLDFSPRQVSDLLGYINMKSATEAELESDRLSKKRAETLWNGYFDQQEDFYLKCHTIASELSRREFGELLGETGHRLWSRLNLIRESL